jgi:protein-tyrosine phosphatase
MSRAALIPSTGGPTSADGDRGGPDGAVNFRDLGGLPTTDGGRVRHRLLYRSETPQLWTAAGVEELVRGRSLRLVVDLRFATEAEREGRGLLGRSGVAYVNAPVVGAAGEDVDEALPHGSGGLLTQTYIGYLTTSPQVFPEVFRLLDAADGLPALLHCAAGKDRTGVTVALLLSTLGVPDEVVVADYATTEANMGAVLDRLRTLPTYAPGIAPLGEDDRQRADPETMVRVLGWLRAEHGSAAGFLQQHGLGPAVIERLRNRLVEPAAG